MVEERAWWVVVEEVDCKARSSAGERQIRRRTKRLGSEENLSRERLRERAEGERRGRKRRERECERECEKEHEGKHLCKYSHRSVPVVRDCSWVNAFGLGRSALSP